LRLGFQDPATPIFQGLVDLHNDIMFYLIIILTFVLWALFTILFEYSFLIRRRSDDLSSSHLLSLREDLFRTRLLAHHTRLEIVWTFIPSLILVIMAIPSFALLYSMDEVFLPQITFKAIGHQWFWSYEFSDYFSSLGDVSFDSNMLFEPELNTGEYRLLLVDNPIVLPVDTNIRVLITSMDVLHSWAVPSLGIKVDACPGRLNQASLFIKRQGVFYGQCSELCGVNHGFMPIMVKAVSKDLYNSWIISKVS